MLRLATHSDSMSLANGHLRLVSQQAVSQTPAGTECECACMVAKNTPRSPEYPRLVYSEVCRQLRSRWTARFATASLW
jgi:hypothetical protein